MGFVSSEGVTPTDPFQSTGRIILSHPSATDSLVLVEVIDEGAYAPTLNGWKTTTGRTLRGQLTVGGGGYINLATELSCSFLARPWQVQQFEILKGYQDTTTQPVTVSNYIEKVVQVAGAPPPNWLPGYPTTGELGVDEGYAAFTAFINTDNSYKSTNQGTAYWLLQFQLLAEL